MPTSRIDPALLRDVPEIEAAMLGARFERGNRVGVWIASRDVAGVPAKVEVDLMVPDAVGGGGRRAARLPGHAKEVARKTRGLEAALIDKTVVSIRALEPADSRSFDVAIAGPAALLIAKAHKIAERVAEREQRRLEDKDALDILRLLQATETTVLARTVKTLLQADVARDVTREALAILKEHFTDARAAGPQMAVRAAGALMPADVVAASCAALRLGSAARSRVTSRRAVDRLHRRSDKCQIIGSAWRGSRPRSADGTEGSLDARLRSRKIYCSER